MACAIRHCRKHPELFGTRSYSTVESWGTMANSALSGQGLTEKLHALIVGELGFTPARPLEPDTPLFEALLDSTSVLTLTSAMENTFAIQIDDSELIPGNFSTLRQLTEFVERKTQRQASQRAAG